MEDMVKLFCSIGLDEKKSRETTKNAKLSAVLKDIIFKANVATGCDKAKGVLLYTVATRVANDLSRHQDLLVDYIVKKKINSMQQLEAAFDFLKNKESVDIPAFEDACGVGVVVTLDQIEAAVGAILQANREQILEERYRTNVGILLAQSREKLRWADGKLLKEEMDKQLSAMLGPRTAADDAPKKKEAKKKEKPEAAAASASTSVEDGSSKRIFEGEVLKLHKPGENPQIKPELMEAHLKATGGKVMTRFPPEPNGFLHIGHAKAMNFNFRYAEVNDGNCYLRFDDTNPEAEEEFYFKSIEDCVRWLGFKPYKVTATSNYFDRLYELAIVMIKKGKAYVCHQTPEEMHASRGGDNKGPRTESPYRNRSIEENLRLFEEMRTGKWDEGKATLRMKMDMHSGNPYMWDPVAYRILRKPHVRTGDKWIIYPTYDFSHCLTDSIENITHSLCTVEFTLARESYYWVCDAVEVYKPVQWEYGRLNITNTVLSKRKLLRLVNEKIVNGWDDPRLYTIEGMRRRGFTPRSINTFCEKVGITTANTTVDVQLLEACLRDDLNNIATRAKVVLDPLRITITNYPEDKVEDIVCPNVTHDPSKGEHVVPFCRTIYIDRSDFREVDEPNYYRLAPGKEVGLQRAYNITCNKIVRNERGEIVELLCTYDEKNTRKPQAHIQWVAHCPLRSSPVPIEVRMYQSLFKSRNPDDHPQGFLADVNPNSLTVIPDALADVTVLNAKPEDKFQFERIGYFCVDRDSKPDHFVFNRTVGLKEDSKKV